VIRFLLYCILLVICWPLALLIALVWIPYKILVGTGKMTAWSIRKTGEHAAIRNANTPQKEDDWRDRVLDLNPLKKIW